MAEGQQGLCNVSLTVSGGVMLVWLLYLMLGEVVTCCQHRLISGWCFREQPFQVIPDELRDIFPHGVNILLCHMLFSGEVNQVKTGIPYFTPAATLNRKGLWKHKEV